MNQTRLKLSIVCPAFEEEAALPAFHQELLWVVRDLEAVFDIEILYVDDGSRDGTLGLLRRWAQTDPRVRYLSLSRNFGGQAAQTAGLEQAQGDLVVTMDSDLQHPPQLLPELIACWRHGYDVVLAIRRQDPDLGWFRRASSNWFYRVMRWLGDTETRPETSDYRLLSRKAVNALLRLRESHRFLRGMVQWLGFASTEVPFSPARRVAGASKYSLSRLFRLGCDALFSFSRAPLRLVALLGILVMTGGLAFTLAALAQAVFGPTASGSFSLGTQTILAALGLVGGTILVSLGIVGEYVGRIYEQLKDRPLYLLRETEQDLVDERAALPEPRDRPVRAAERQVA